MSTSLINICPSCGRVIDFRSNRSNVNKCNACGDVVMRSPAGKLEPKPQHLLRISASIIQPGTEGKYQGHRFFVTGRFRAWMEETVFNYWTLVLEGREELILLAEGYGLYFIYSPPANEKSLKKQQVSSAVIGATKDLGEDRRFAVQQKDQVFRWELEGECWVPDPRRDNFVIAEWSNPSGRSFCFMQSGEQEPVQFECNAVSFVSLELTNLRNFEYGNYQFECTQCHQQLHVKTWPYAQSCSCKVCGSQYAMKAGSEFKRGDAQLTKDEIYLPLGSLGKIEGIEYEVLGFACKEEQNKYRSRWREYTLFSPKEGYAFLSEYDGHWIYIREKADSPILLNQNDQSFTIDNEPFQLFNKYKYKVINAIGEFPGNIFDDTNATAREFISPPEIWIEERDQKEGITWFFGKHLSSGSLKKAFSVNSMPWRSGIGAVQPKGYINLHKLIATTVVAAFAIVLLHFMAVSGKASRSLYRADINFGESNTFIKTVRNIQLEKKHSNLRINIFSPVQNSWAQLEVTLTNNQTGEEFNVDQGVEYYYGYSDGENWKEGSQQETAWLSSIPAGSYTLVLRGSRSVLEAGRPSFIDAEVLYDVPVSRNLWYALLLLMLWPVGKYISINYWEQVRWSDSPFSIYES